MGNGACQLCVKRRPRSLHSWHAAYPTRHTIGRSVGIVTADRRQSVGRRGEELAAQHLVRRGFQILDRNFRTRWGELDIVAFDGSTLTFCEVKTRRTSGSAITPFDSVTARKRRQVRKIARAWLAGREVSQFAATLRFDAIGVTLDRSGELVSLDHLEGAF
jgi:putative endonuclease